MPKYIPTLDDVYETKPCFICGGDVLDENSETCCWMCQQEKEYFDDYWTDYMWKEYEGFPDE